METLLRVDLPSGGWVEMREVPRPLDGPALSEAGYKIEIEVRPDGSEVRHATGGAEERMIFALLARVITAWSFDGVPVPSQNIAKPEEVLDTVFTDPDDWDKICEAVRPLMDRILKRSAPKPAETATSS